jgi:uncharacterized protein (TIGR03000 family)
MLRRFSVLAAVALAAAFALSPGLAVAQHRGGYRHQGRDRDRFWENWAIAVTIGYPWYGGDGPYDYGAPYYDAPYYDTYPYPADSGTPLAKAPAAAGPRIDPEVAARAFAAYRAYLQSAPAADEPARVSVLVPADAKVWFDDKPTRQSGTVREFETAPLTPGHEYTYHIRAQWREGDRDVTQTRQVDIRANSAVTVDFTRTAPAVSTATGAGGR